jgi:hypothetical protein
VQPEIVELLAGACAADEDRHYGAVIGDLLRDAEVVIAGDDAMDSF